ncbi:Bax inhibitor-1 family protein [Botrimarina sp.]|uniref:Bax inhibitor-1/YccA family protein n=1 Tax=Botrimarina sp. TaxID=2795802 RepID=UPI0032EB9F34
MAAADIAAENPYAAFGRGVVADAAPDERVAFVRKTYMHLAAAVYGLAAILWVMFRTGFAEWFTRALGGTPYGMLLMLAGFIGASWIANRWAMDPTATVSKQYAGLWLYVFAQALFLAPMLWFAQDMAVEYMPGQEVNVVGAAALTTLVLFAGLSAIPWLTGKDFSFLGAALGIVGLGALALIVASFIFPINMGIWFSVAMIVFASAYILYDTSNVMHHYQPGQHVAASLALFASVALLFWYVLRLFMALSSRD